MASFEKDYEHIRDGGSGFYEQLHGLIAVWGKEAVQFLDGMITNDLKTLGDGKQMIAAFPNAQGRLLALSRILRQGDRFLIEIPLEVREKLHQNLFRFTFAGDFFVEDVSDHYCQTTIWNSAGFPFATFSASGEDEVGSVSYRGVDWAALPSIGGGEVDLWIPATQIQEDFLQEFHQTSSAINVSDEVYEVLRIENGIPMYGVDMDETTIVPELGLDSMISYNKGCYIGQEIIARIHFRGHVAKRLTGLVSEPGAVATGFLPGAELTTEDGKNAGRITSVTFSPKLEKEIALGFVRYDYLGAGTEVFLDDVKVSVTSLPFIG